MVLWLRGAVGNSLELEAGCVLDLRLAGVGLKVWSQALQSRCGRCRGCRGSGFGAGLETFSRIELPCPTALSVRSTKPSRTALNMTAHHVVAFERTLAAPRGPKAVGCPRAERASEVRALPLWSSTQ